MTVQFDRLARTGASATQRDAVERADSYLLSHMSLPVPVSYLSRVVGLSERGLRSAFQSVVGMSPKRYMRTVRLFAVRSALCQTDTRRVTVTDAATGFGFFELGRFAAAYRQEFGERPSDTLRRTGNGPARS